MTRNKRKTYPVCQSHTEYVSHVLSTAGDAQYNWMKKNQKHGGLAHENGVGSA
jgi:hypothetical protein